MLQVYTAELNDTQLTWENKPPKALKQCRVLVIVEENTPPIASETDRYRLDDLTGKLTWQGDALQEQREQRDAW